MKDQRVLITGVRGRVGMSIALELAGNNEVHGISRGGGYAKECLEKAGGVFHQMGMGQDGFDALPEHFDYIFHQAVTWGVATPEDEKAAYNVSVKGVVEMLKKYGPGAKRIVLGSTGGVAAASEDLVKETALRLPNEDAYHSYKFAMEVIGEAFADLEGVDVVIARYYWPWAEHNGFPHTWIIVPMLRDEPVSVCESKPNRFTPIFMPDCVRHSIACAEADDVPRVINISGPETVSLKEMAEITGEILGKVPEFDDTRESMPTFLGDASLSVTLFGAHEYGVRRSLEAAVEWHRRNPEEHKKRDIFDAPKFYSQ